MKKFFAMLLVCIFVLSIMFSLSSCRNRQKEDPTPDVPTTENGETVEGGSGINDGKIKLPAIKIPGLTPTPEE